MTWQDYITVDPALAYAAELAEERVVPLPA